MVLAFWQRLRHRKGHAELQSLHQYGVQNADCCAEDPALSKLNFAR